MALQSDGSLLVAVSSRVSNVQHFNAYGNQRFIAGDLRIDCRQGPERVGLDNFASRASASATLGNLGSAGLGYLVDKRNGAGFNYPDTITVLMQSPGRPDASAQSERGGNPVF